MIWNKYYVVGMLVLACGTRIAMCQRNVNVVMYTDLEHMIGKNYSCAPPLVETSNESLPEVNPQPGTQGILLSKHKFYETDRIRSTIGKCDEREISSQVLWKNNWTCFTIGNRTDHDLNWIFVNCLTNKILTIQCTKTGYINEILESVCRNVPRDQLCHSFQLLSSGNSVWCSKVFRIEKTYHRKLVETVTPTSTWDILACLCAAFILITFFLSVLIPAEKCKPTYRYDKEVGLRVPMQIYEMYGVSYQPSAKKRREARLQKRMSSFRPCIVTHKTNVAAIANIANNPEQCNDQTKCSVGSVSANNKSVSFHIDAVDKHDVGNQSKDAVTVDVENGESVHEVEHGDPPNNDINVTRISNDNSHQLYQINQSGEQEKVDNRHEQIHQSYEFNSEVDLQMSDSFLKLPQPKRKNNGTDILSSNLQDRVGSYDQGAEAFMCDTSRDDRYNVVNISIFTDHFPKTNRIATIANRTTFSPHLTPPLQATDKITQCNCGTRKPESIAIGISKERDESSSILKGFQNGEFIDCSTMAIRPRKETRCPSLDSSGKHYNVFYKRRSSIPNEIRPPTMQISRGRSFNIDQRRLQFRETKGSAVDTDYHMGTNSVKRSYSAMEMSTRESCSDRDRKESITTMCSQCGHFNHTRRQSNASSNNSDGLSQNISVEDELIRRYMQKSKSRKFSMC